MLSAKVATHIGSMQQFTGWLYAQRHRDDRVGDLARDARMDRDWPSWCRTLTGYRRYMERVGACDAAVASLDIAWRQWEQRPAVAAPVGE
jgi:uncharacterized protein YozE (UPF0346 family)